MPPVGKRMVELVVPIPRLLCKDCGAIRQPTLSFADPKKHYTHSLERFVIDLCRVMTLQDVAELTGLSWDIHLPKDFNCCKLNGEAATSCPV